MCFICEILQGQIQHFKNSDTTIWQERQNFGKNVTKYNQNHTDNKKGISKHIANSFYNYYIIDLIYKRKLRKKVGIISLRHEVNIGNNLIKYAISIIIKQLGYTPYIVGTHWRNFNISFLSIFFIIIYSLLISICKFIF